MVQSTVASKPDSLPSFSSFRFFLIIHYGGFPSFLQSRRTSNSDATTIEQ
ncbi:hypothetical protein HanPSC8_Chr11g0492511 [Helianthus annuus]|nr:hypothetical protein HanPSC8_Chr11g0492511 [Helianthus annuus]